MNRQDKHGARTPAEFGRMYDHVVESGEKNGWMYRKWKSGVMECWCERKVESAFTETWGSLFCSNNRLTPIKYPFAYMEQPQEYVSTVTSGTQGWHALETSNSKEKSGQYYMVRPTEVVNSTIITYKLFVVGKYRLLERNKRQGGDVI